MCMPIIKYGHRHSFYNPNNCILLGRTLHQYAHMNREAENESEIHTHLA